MHDIEPYYRWRDDYIASEDRKSPFYGQVYNEFQYTQKIYNYFIHPQWDQFGSQTLYLKVLYVDYSRRFAFIELIGEWNDCIGNDIMYLKREVIDPMIRSGIVKFALSVENVLNYHSSDDSYYEEWWDDIKDDGGWICLLDVFDHVKNEMDGERLYYYINYGAHLNNLRWRNDQPQLAYKMVKHAMNNKPKKLSIG